MCLYPIQVKKKGSVNEYITVNCSKCVECMRASSNEWALRIMLESSFHDETCFLTLTYNNEHLPKDGQLCRRDLQLFIKRLREHIAPLKLRVFYSGEYGSKGQRPHYHVILFGYRPKDLRFFFADKDVLNYRSVEIEKLWPLGYCLVGDLTYQSAFYCAKYMQKAIFSDKEVKPFIGMSNRPGIGFAAIDIKKLLEQKAIYFNGKKYNIPRYFLKVLDRSVDAMDEDLMQIHIDRSLALFNSVRRTSQNSIEEKRKKSKKLLDG